MICTIKLLNGVPFTKDKNFAVDDIETYISSLPAVLTRDFTNLNYFKQGLKTVVRLPMTQEALDFSDRWWNYCVVTNWNEQSGVPDKKVYYFIDSMKWASKDVCTLELTMDTINTIGVNESKYTNKTLIHRQHKNRYFVAGGRAKGIIDKAKEGIDTLLYKTNNNILKPKQNYMQGKWYIVYRTKNQPVATDYEQVNPVQMLLLPETETYIQPAGIGGTIGTQSPFAFYKNYTFSSYMNGSYSFDITPESSGNPMRHYKIYDTIPERADGLNAHRVYYYLVLEWLSTSAHFYYQRAVVNASGEILSDIVQDSGVIQDYTAGEGVVNGYISHQGACKSIFYYYESNVLYYDPLVTPNKTRYYTKAKVNGIADIDRTDARLIKIVEFPYCPLEIIEPTISSGGLVFNDKFDFASEVIDGTLYVYIQLPETFSTLTCEIETSLNGFNETKYMDFDPTTKHKTDLRNGNYELKLYNSEFYGRKFVYDSFSYNFKYEEANISGTYTAMQNKFKFKMLTSLAVTSKFAFDFTPSWKIAQVTEDYPNILPIARNNEIPIYNSQYLTYLRTGLQYDLKAREREKEQDIGKIVLSTAGSVIGTALGVATGNAVLTAGSVVAGITGVASSIVSAVNRSITAQQSLEQKLAQLKAQSASVQASDDLDLMRGYTEGNWAKIELYQPSANMSQCLFDLFYYTGYKCEYMERPALNTRNRFNFISASIDFDPQYAMYLAENYGEDIREDYKQRFEAGLTIIHHYNNEWDFEQKYENWEAILESYLQ